MPADAGDAVDGGLLAATTASGPGNRVRFVPRCILVTGGAGFIASHVVIHLVKKYPEYMIVNLDKLDYCSSLDNVKEVAGAPNYRFVHANILDANKVRSVLSEYKVDTIMHFAAQTHVDNSFDNSFRFTENNIMGTHVLLEAAKEHRIKRFIHVSTDEVYGEIVNHDSVAEESVLEPTNPYAATKAAAEFLVKAYHRSFQMPVIITRGNNVYGPHQYPEKLIPKFINLLQRGQRLPIHGSGDNRRTFIYVTDVARAFDVILHYGNAAKGEILNVGSDREYSTLDVAKALIKLFGLQDRESELIYHVADRKFNDFRYWIDSSKLKDLGWSQQVSWEHGLFATKNWYMNLVGQPWGNIDNALRPHPLQEPKQEADAPFGMRFADDTDSSLSDETDDMQQQPQQPVQQHNLLLHHADQVEPLSPTLRHASVLHPDHRVASDSKNTALNSTRSVYAKQRSKSLGSSARVNGSALRQLVEGA